MVFVNVENAPPSPGDKIKALLVERNLSQTDFAAITGLTRQTINSLITGRSGISPETAVILAAAFGNEASEWLRMDSEYRLAAVSVVDAKEVQKRAALMQIAPIREMQKRGWIRQTDSFEDLEAELSHFFETSDLNSGLSVAVAFRRNTMQSSDERSVRAWYYRARQLARLLQVPPFNEGKMDVLIRELRRIARYAKNTPHVPTVLAKYGIRFVIVEPLPSTRVDGAAFWLDEKSPVVAMSVRYDRVDSFWFTLMHEIMHIKHKDAASIDDGLFEESQGAEFDTNVIEERANTQAAAALIEPAQLDSFIKRVAPLYSEQRINQFAHRLEIHPGIVVGQLQRRQELSYSTLRPLLVKVRDMALETALTDGWGKTLPSGI